ncbi:hypothetical protein QIT48_gp29 [Haloterrigena jeotgali icosahedral virus 1]|uniref:Uncharacterized protein n=2 Tax=root TaxID=1 RepID=A0AAF0T3H7_9EURY|nr:hypothetical protein [Natrinema thermotolerans]YP_010772666.1 hypothetical protein QIT48_gp29 [Haloterrigena jeotgali icosahedral virus 1]QCC57401.1 hypothetical protein DVR14_01600 [Natrinema thermotolerans]WMT10395.1 hypothetical protein NP511_22800 [Natrinema thermotolerans]WPH65808.1 hypothetical protein HJIV1_gp17 [Haloterrigena jeotgali icosahedral virus 1]DAC85306.1 TPA_asm: hypothetical protein HJIV1gp28 [Haloterrigena jeotgali icosahedral virus 1]
MTVIGEKTATYETLLSDLVTELLTYSNWSDADTYVTNDGSDTSWYNNGRVLQDSNTGTFLLMYLSGGQWHEQNGTQRHVSGIKFVISTDWDSTNHYPTGYTNVGSQSGLEANALVSNVSNDAPATYDDFNATYANHSDYDYQWFASPYGVWGSNNNLSRDTIRGTSVSYIMSVKADGFNIGTWNSNDGNNGIASVTSYEYLSDRFFDDPGIPLIGLTRTSDIAQAAIYGFTSYSDSDSTHTNRNVGFDNSPVEDADWGIINPSSEDDTFFFRYPAAFNTTAKTVPVAYLRQTIPNDSSEGGAHGDDFTHNSTNYRVFAQSGASTSTVLSMGLRHE